MSRVHGSSLISVSSAIAMRPVVVDASASVEVMAISVPAGMGRLVAQGFVIRWKKGAMIRLNFRRELTLQTGQAPYLLGLAARVRIETTVGVSDVRHAGAPRSVGGFVRFLLDPVAYRNNADADDFARWMMESGGGPAGADFREALLPALVGKEISGLLIAFCDAGPAIEPARLEAAIAVALAHPQSSANLWNWLQRNRACSIVRLLFALGVVPAEDPSMALTKLMGKRRIVESLRVLPADWIAQIVERMPTQPQIRRQYYSELLPALKSLRHALALQPKSLRETCVGFAAFCCNWIAHYRESRREKLGVGECSALLDNTLNPSFGEYREPDGIDTRHMVRFLKLAVDALKTVRSEEDFVQVQRSARRIASWLAGSNSRINPELLRQALFERLLEHAELWRVELFCSASPWADCLAPNDASGAVWTTMDARHHRLLLFFPVRSELELVQAGHRFQNCLRADQPREGYRVDCMRGHSRVFKIGTDTGKSLALLCLDWSREESRWVVGDIKGVANSRVVGLEGAISDFADDYNRLQPHPYRAVV